MSSDKRKITDKDILVSIAMFDLWMANEDRHQGHYNLLLQEENEEFKIIPIDHEFIFNTNCLNNERPVVILTENESLFSSDVFKALISRRRRNEILANWDDFKNLHYLRIQMCKASLDLIFSELPSEWQININDKKELLLSTIFSESWANDVFLNSQHYLNL
jgi:hypothetical protein